MIRTLTVGICVALLALSACSDDDDATTDTSASAGDPIDDTTASDGPDAIPEDSDGADAVPPLDCPPVDEVATITGIEIADLSGPAVGDPSELSCQYMSDDAQFSTGTAVYISLDPVDGGPIGFGDAVAGLGEWAEVEAEEGVIYVGFGGAMLEIGTYGDLSSDQLIELVEATLAAGEAA